VCPSTELYRKGPHHPKNTLKICKNNLTPMFKIFLYRKILPTLLEKGRIIDINRLNDTTNQLLSYCTIIKRDCPFKSLLIFTTFLLVVFLVLVLWYMTEGSSPR
jgi:hypothetical protein